MCESDSVLSSLLEELGLLYRSAESASAAAVETSSPLIPVQPAQVVESIAFAGALLLTIQNYLL